MVDFGSTKVTTPDENGRIMRDKVTLKSGVIYEGQWKDDKKNGQGIYKCWIEECVKPNNFKHSIS